MARDLNRGLHALAREAVMLNYSGFVGLALGQAALQCLPLVTGSVGGPALAAGLLASLLQIPLLYLALHSMTVGGSALDGPLPPPRFWRFAGRFLLLGVPATLILLTIDDPVAMLFMLLLVSVATMGLFGTILPDSVAGERPSWAAALARGQATFVSFLLWMLGGPALTLVGIGIVLGILGSILAGSGIGAASGAGDGRLAAAWAVGLIVILSALGGAYATALTAAVLAKCWHRGAGGRPR